MRTAKDLPVGYISLVRKGREVVIRSMDISMIEEVDLTLIVNPPSKLCRIRIGSDTCEVEMTPREVLELVVESYVLQPGSSCAQISLHDEEIFEAARLDFADDVCEQLKIIRLLTNQIDNDDLRARIQDSLLKLSSSTEKLWGFETSVL